MEEKYDLVIIGSGPAGLAAAIYAQRARLNTLVIEKEMMSGGQILTTYEVDNYPGFPGIGGFDLGMKLRQHAEQLEAVFVVDEIQKIEEAAAAEVSQENEKQPEREALRGTVKWLEKEKQMRADEQAKAEARQIAEKLEAAEVHAGVSIPWKRLIGKKNTYLTKSVIIASGAKHRLLGVAGEKELTGMGVSYCATCDGAFFKNKVTAVVGGGDVALEDAIFLARMCEHVYLIHRRGELRGAKVLQDRLRSLNNVTILWDSVVEEIKGTTKVEALAVKNVKTGECTDLEVSGVFIAVGIIPNSQPYEGLVQMENGYICADESCETSVSGIFAAGDVRTKSLRQILTAAADGANAVTSAERYLTEL